MLTSYRVRNLFIFLELPLIKTEKTPQIFKFFLFLIIFFFRKNFIIPNPNLILYINVDDRGQTNKT